MEASCSADSLSARFLSLISKFSAGFRDGCRVSLDPADADLPRLTQSRGSLAFFRHSTQSGKAMLSKFTIHGLAAKESIMRGLVHHLRLRRHMNFPSQPKTRRFTVAAAAKSRRGSHNEFNEDCYRMDARRGVFVVADGLGGQAGGELASRLAAGGLMRDIQLYLRRKDRQGTVSDAIGQALRGANESMLHVGEFLPRFRGMGASAAIAVVDDNRLYVSGVGDCRAYLLRDGSVQRLTVDQTLFQMLFDAGLTHDRQQHARSRRLLWASLGDSKFVSPEVRCEELQANDRLLLVTNGVTRVLKDGLFGRLNSITEDDQDLATHVVNAASTLGTKDDATCVSVSFATPTSQFEQ